MLIWQPYQGSELLRRQEHMDRLKRIYSYGIRTNDYAIRFRTDEPYLTEFRQPLQGQSHLEMPGILVQLGHIQCT